MSYDLGNNSSDFDYQIRARLRAAMAEERIGWSDLCTRAGVSEAAALRAVQAGSSGLPATMPILQRLSWALGRELDWIVAGAGDGGSQFRISLSEKVLKLVWEYVYKAGIRHAEGLALAKYAKRLVGGLGCSTEQGAYRRGVPRTWKDIARLKAELDAMNRNGGGSGVQL